MRNVCYFIDWGVRTSYISNQIAYYTTPATRFPRIEDILPSSRVGRPRSRRSLENYEQNMAGTGRDGAVQRTP